MRSSIRLTSGFLVLFLNCLHHETKSLLDSEEYATGLGGFAENGRGWSLSEPVSGLPVMVMREGGVV